MLSSLTHSVPALLTRLRPRLSRLLWLVAFIAIVAISSFQVLTAYAEGSTDLYPPTATGFRGSLEWRTNDNYGGLITRRTLLKVYVKAGEVILMGSTAVGVGAADIRVYDDATQISGPIGSETIAGAPLFSCNTQRGAGPTFQGQILSRAMENLGPDTVPAGGVPGGYEPCTFAPGVTGIYDVAIYGPDGDPVGGNGGPTGQINIGTAGGGNGNFDATQGTSVAAWDVTVRGSLTSHTNITGRLFSYAMALFMASNNQPINSTLYAVTTDGYRHQVNLNGVDGLGFMLYANKEGYFDSDGSTPLYHDILGNNALGGLHGGVTLARPEYPIFFNLPDPAALTALGIPLVPIKPTVSNFKFTGTAGGNKSNYTTGGTFDFDVTNGVVTQIVISSNTTTPNFDPTLPTNRVLRITMPYSKLGTHHTVVWDGLDNSGNPFPVSASLLKPYPVQIIVHGGEIHFPLLDVENSFQGGPSFTMLNPPGACPWIGGCSGAFYDDRNYRTLNGTIAWNTQPVNVELCGGGAPGVANADTIRGYDSRSADRGYGIALNANAQLDCTTVPAVQWGGFGDAKGLDEWTYFPSAPGAANLLIIGPQADLAISKTDGTTTYKPGGTTTYTIKVTNNGPSDVVGATVADTFPASITGATWTCVAAPAVAGNGCTGAGAGNITDTVDLLAGAGNSLTYTVVATIAAGATGTLSNTATVATPPGITDLVPGNNTSTDNDDPPGGPGGGAGPTPVPGTLTFTKVADKVVAKPGDAVTFTLTAHNGGATPVTGAVVTDPVPSMFIVKSATSTQGTTSVAGNTVTFTIGTINPGQTVTMKVFTIIDPALKPPASATNVAVLNSNEYGPLSASVSFDYSASDPGVVRQVAGFLPSTGEHPDSPITTPWWYVIPVGFAAMAITLRRRREND